MGMRWWEHAGLDLAGVRETSAAAAAEEVDEDGMEE